MPRLRTSERDLLPVQDCPAVLEDDPKPESKGCAISVECSDVNLLVEIVVPEQVLVSRDRIMYDNYSPVCELVL